jgi:hypothetical protein
MAYDEVRGRTVLFGGDNPSLLGDTWEWDGNDWTQMNDVGPGGRGGHAMAFGGDDVILFGGQNGASTLADTWSWNGEDWTQLSDGGPAPRFNHALAFDASRRRVVLFGGAPLASAPGKELLSDTWEWDGNEWTQQEDIGPAKREMHVMAYDSARQRIVLFGGAVQGGETSLGDTWEWNGSIWTQVASFGATPCSGAAAAYKGDAIGLFGGKSFLAALPGARLFATTWEWDGKHWALRQDIGPFARWAHAMAFDSKRNHMVLFGGLSGPAPDPAAFLGDTWEHSEQQGQETPPSGQPAQPTSPPGQPGQPAGPALQAVSIEPSQVNELPAVVTVTVTLSGPAPAGGLQVQLTSSPPVGGGLLMVPSGATTGQVGIEINATAMPGPVTVTATLGQVSKSATFNIPSGQPGQPAGPTLQDVIISPPEVHLSNPTQMLVTVTLTGPAPAGGLQVLLTANPQGVLVGLDVGLLAVPAGATGNQRPIGISLAAISDPAPVIQMGNVLVTATLGQVSKSATLNILS